MYLSCCSCCFYTLLKVSEYVGRICQPLFAMHIWRINTERYYSLTVNTGNKCSMSNMKYCSVYGVSKRDVLDNCLCLGREMDSWWIENKFKMINSGLIYRSEMVCRFLMKRSWYAMLVNAHSHSLSGIYFTGNY